MALCKGGLLRSISDQQGRYKGYTFMCPGCEHAHAVYMDWEGKHCWQFNGDEEHPTFSPSLLIQWDDWEPPVTPENHEEYKRAPWQQHKVHKVCHSYIRDGQIQFLGDCTHKLASQTVPLPKQQEDHS